MELSMNSTLTNIQRSGIRIFTQMARNEPDCLFLTLGEPDFHTPAPICAAAKESLDRGETHYPENNGQQFLREAISAFEQEKHNLHYSDGEIIVTVGATEALFCALFGILNPGDEVIVPMPAFGLYEAIIKLCRGVCIPLNTSSSEFQMTESQLSSVITPRTKAIILTSPNNPTGCIYDHNTLEAIHAVLKDLPVFVICDEVYRDLIYTDVYESFMQYTDMRDRLIGVQSFSKPYAMTGWRVGYLMADLAVKQQLEKVHQYNVVSVSSFVQHACAKALQYDIQAELDIYRERRDYVCSRLDQMGLPYFKPQGAFYIFPSIARYGMDSYTFCERMVKEGKLACTPGSCFGAEGFMRISYCYSDEILKKGMDRLERFLNMLEEERHMRKAGGLVRQKSMPEKQ